MHRFVWYNVDGDEVLVGVIIEAMRLKDIRLIVYKGHHVFLQCSKFSFGVNGIDSHGQDNAVLKKHLCCNVTVQPVDFPCSEGVEDINVQRAYNCIWTIIVEDDALELGPFQGDVACYTIKKGRGVCGKAWEDKQTVVVPNVLQFPCHIACSSKSRSEIVVPVFKGDDVIAVIDVDSKGYSAFDDIDKDGLEKIAKIISPLFMTC